MAAEEDPSGSDTQMAAILLQPPNSPPRIVVTQAHRLGEMLTFDDPVDARAFGSPVWVQGGFAGMIQDRRSAIPADRLQRDLR